ncbi:hypothetical protein GJ744_001289 [Endocarpon pusillum]|uniref:Uncharacterized protein n=1 Tax=Endocarpon pusillum TaxID=364733 RepID=A0A8H7AH57_9EURO|nr:hypothetical protein GJ744_001289 [Endocarpon pusillum]
MNTVTETHPPAIQSQGSSAEDMNTCEICRWVADCHEAHNHRFNQLQAHIADLSNKLLSAGKSNQRDRIEVVKLHASLRDQNRQLQRVALIAADLEDALKAAAQETMDLRYRVKISDNVLQALREAREVDVSDRFCLSGLVQEAVYRAGAEQMQQHSEREERLTHSHERALEPIEGLAIETTHVAKGHDKTSSMESSAVMDGSHESMPLALLAASVQKLDSPTPPGPVPEEIGRESAWIVDD